MAHLTWLAPDSYLFPNPANALDEPEGLLAAGGDLTPERILCAYRLGIFPWFNPGDPILWWSPNPRTVIFPAQLHISRSLRKWLRRDIYQVTFDQAFEQVMRACAAPRTYANDTWISEEIVAAYNELHRRGYAHSIEVWRSGVLVGGLYGMAMGKVFFGESMFSCADNASKIGLAHLVQLLRAWHFELIDCQVANEHLFSLGATEIPRSEFQQMLVDFAHSSNLYPTNWSQIAPPPVTW